MIAHARQYADLTEATPTLMVRRRPPAPGFQDASTLRMYTPFGPNLRVVIALPTAVGARRYVLKSHLTIRLSYQDDGTVFASHATLPVHGYGPSEEEALTSFADSFDWQWQHLTTANDDELTEPARVARDAMRAAVESVRG